MSQRTYEALCGLLLIFFLTIYYHMYQALGLALSYTSPH